jgi:hypothetical protein
MLREIIAILLDSPFYLGLPGRERLALVKLNYQYMLRAF